MLLHLRHLRVSLHRRHYRLDRARLRRKLLVLILHAQISQTHARRNSDAADRHVHAQLALFLAAACAALLLATSLLPGRRAAPPAQPPLSVPPPPPRDTPPFCAPEG